ncbi:unnamed protein product [Effrenium voratum]|uniref:ceramidase n=1 Tax=Effrenium voratum TaxID=2562239 RepID=A0AA36ILP7_9DINO|nr:unnamed protein product [Effrenium voratum]
MARAAFVWLATASALEMAPRFVLDLKKPPEERWEGAVDLILQRHGYAHSFAPVFAEHNATLFDHLTAEHFEALGQAVERHFPSTAAELKGLARQFQGKGFAVSFQYLAAWLYFHELAHSDAKATDLEARECTGIVTQAADGSILHVANMDQSPLAARNLTIRVSVVSSSGDLLFEGVDWYTLLSTGMSRAVKRGVGSVQENWRTTTVRKLEDVMADIERGVVSQMLVFRHAFEKEDVLTFPDFVAHVTQVPLAAPFYIVAAGTKPGEGVAIARNLTGADGIDQLADADDFYLCQCNTDRWLPDDVLDPRRTAAERLLRDMGQAEGAMQMGLFAVSSAYPVHNPHTAYTAVMSAATGELHAYIREASCPLHPDASIVRDRRYCLHAEEHVFRV